jgi:cell shape-determining protein MreC
MILGIDVNLLIEVVLGIVALYVLVLIAVTVFGGFACTKTMLHYTAKFWWVILIVVGFIIAYIALTSKKKNTNTEIERLRQIEDKTKEDEAELKRLEAEKKKIEDDIQTTTDEFKKKLEELKKKESKPGDAGRSSDDMNNAWSRK